MRERVERLPVLRARRKREGEEGIGVVKEERKRRGERGKIDRCLKGKKMG